MYTDIINMIYKYTLYIYTCINHILHIYIYIYIYIYCMLYVYIHMYLNISCLLSCIELIYMHSDIYSVAPQTCGTLPPITLCKHN